jgi:hypothetical protein
MASLLNSPWINVAAALVGGLSLGFGLRTLLAAPTPGGAFFIVAGVIILWWALADRRKMQRGNPESEADGSHTIE